MSLCAARRTIKREHGGGERRARASPDLVAAAGRVARADLCERGADQRGELAGALRDPAVAGALELTHAQPGTIGALAEVASDARAPRVRRATAKCYDRSIALVRRKPRQCRGLIESAAVAEYVALQY